MAKFSLIIHGGCGNVEKFSRAQQKEFLKAMDQIVVAGGTALQKGCSAVEAVILCVSMLEDNPLFNAGKGAVLNEKGKVEMDASIMSGIDLSAGAVASLTTAKNPIQVAEAVRVNSPHVFLVGKGANQFVRQQKLTQKKLEYFLTSARIAQLEEAKSKDFIGLDHGQKTSTVGAVAFDQNGNLAAGTSTGGLVNKKFGRTGDSCVIGAGVYADNRTGGVSTTGIGEHFLRTTLAKYISDLIELKGFSAHQAANHAISKFKNDVAGYGGVIVIDRLGSPAFAFSTQGLIRSSITHEMRPLSELF